MFPCHPQQKWETSEHQAHLKCFKAQSIYDRHSTSSSFSPNHFYHKGGGGADSLCNRTQLPPKLNLKRCNMCFMYGLSLAIRPQTRSITTATVGGALASYLATAFSLIIKVISQMGRVCQSHKNTHSWKQTSISSVLLPVTLSDVFFFSMYCRHCFYLTLKLFFWVWHKMVWLAASMCLWNFMVISH